MHVFEPTAFPLPDSSKAAYVPPTAPISEAKRILSPYLPRMVVVQPSTYGTDNSCQLDGVRALGGCNDGRKSMACAVIEVDPNTVTNDQLKQYHAQGARGFRCVTTLYGSLSIRTKRHLDEIRVNFVSRGLRPSPAELRTTLQTYADLARPFGWVVQMYTPMEDIEAFADLLEGDALG
jgi:hypothetical protein